MSLLDGLAEIRPTGATFAAYYRGVHLGEYADLTTTLRRLLDFANLIVHMETL